MPWISRDARCETLRRHRQGHQGEITCIASIQYSVVVTYKCTPTRRTHNYLLILVRARPSASLSLRHPQCQARLPAHSSLPSPSRSALQTAARANTATPDSSRPARAVGAWAPSAAASSREARWSCSTPKSPSSRPLRAACPSQASLAQGSLSSEVTGPCRRAVWGRYPA